MKDSALEIALVQSQIRRKAAEIGNASLAVVLVKYRCAGCGATRTTSTELMDKLCPRCRDRKPPIIADCGRCGEPFEIIPSKKKIANKFCVLCRLRWRRTASVLEYRGHINGRWPATYRDRINNGSMDNAIRAMEDAFDDEDLFPPG